MNASGDDPEKSPFYNATNNSFSPVWPFRPRKFSSPFPCLPMFEINDSPERRHRTELPSFSFDSGLGTTAAESDQSSKSKLCPKYHIDGFCELGPNCPFTHEEKQSIKAILFNPTAPEFIPRSRIKYEEELSTSDSGVQSISQDLTDLAIRSAEASSSETDSSWLCHRSKTVKFKTEPCITFHTIGSCPYGSKCHFYHKKDEKRKNETHGKLWKAWNTGTSFEVGSSAGGGGYAQRKVKYRTRMCKEFAATGKCRYGMSCTFAHKKSEKRQDLSTVYKFKTELCQMWLKGRCSYGDACHFAHGYKDLKSEDAGSVF